MHMEFFPSFIWSGPSQSLHLGLELSSALIPSVMTFPCSARYCPLLVVGLSTPFAVHGFSPVRNTWSPHPQGFALGCATIHTPKGLILREGGVLLKSRIQTAVKGDVGQFPHYQRHSGDFLSLNPRTRSFPLLHLVRAITLPGTN